MTTHSPNENTWSALWLKYRLLLLNIFKAILLIGLGWLLWHFLSNTIFTLLLAGLFFLIFDPAVDLIQKGVKSRKVAIAIFFVTLLFILGIFFGIMVPDMINQVGKFASQYPQIFSELEIRFQEILTNIERYPLFEDNRIISQIGQLFDNFFERINQHLLNSIKSLFKMVGNVFSGTITLVVAMIISIYLLLDERSAEKYYRDSIQSRLSTRQRHVLNEVHKSITRYAKGIFFLAFILFLVYWLIYSLFGIPYAIILAFWGGVMMLLPIIGPLLAIIPAVIIALIDSWEKALLLLVVYLIIQFVESNILTPNILGKRMDTKPLFIIIFMMVGAELAGILGMVLAVPVGTVALRAYRVLQKESQKE